MNINSQSLKFFRTKFSNAIKDLEEEFGIGITLGGISYDSDGFRSTMQVININEDEKGKDPKVIQMERDWKEWCGAYGFKESDLGKQFESNGRTFAITGIKPKSRKYAIIADDVRTGGSYKFTAESVTRSLKK
jgi:hypothetical protein